MTHTHIKEKKYKNGMLRGSEVSKDSYHASVKKIKTIRKLRTELN